jgi:hypothetical protein
MRKQREQRTDMKLGVRVWGMDSSGKLFSVEAATVDVTAVGACIAGDLEFLHRGAIVGVECGKRRARFRVVWSKNGKIGVTCIEPGKYIWGLALKRKMEANPAAQADNELSLPPAYAAHSC